MIDRALRLTREFHRMKQGDLAKQLGISTSYLSEIEHGKKAASLDLLDQYSNIFKVPASTFLIFKERANGKQDKGVNDHAKRLLDFFAWVTSDDEGAGEAEEKPAEALRDPKKAVPTT